MPNQNTKLPYDTNTLLKQTQAMLDQTKAEGSKSFATSSFNTFSSTSPATAPAPVKAPDLPEPTASEKNETFFSSLTGTVDTARKTLEQSYKDQLATITKDKDTAQKKMDDLTEKQDVLLETDIEPLLKPFRETLENKERERLYINENFEANQKLTNELETLLNEGNKLVSLEKERPIPNVFVTSNVNKRMSDIAARAGVIEAVMSARSGQIAEAYRLIDRSVDAITADRRDQLAYYETVFNFYETQKDAEGKKILSLEADEKDFIKEKIGLLKGDLEQAEQSVNYIKSLMVDPESARFMADAGVTLNDSMETVNQKIAEQGRREEVATLKNELLAKGYTYVPFPAGRKDVKTFEVAGQTLAFVPPPEKGDDTDTDTNTFISTDDLIALGLPEDKLADAAKALAQERIKDLGTGGEREQATSALAVFDNAKALIGLLDDGVKTGPVVGRLKGGISLFGVPIMPSARGLNLTTDKANEFKAASTIFTANFIKSISGAQVSDKEREFLMAALPDENNQERVNRSNIKMLTEFVANRVGSTLNMDVTPLLPSDESVTESEKDNAYLKSLGL